MKHYIIYIPGLGDHYDGVRRFFLRFWKIYGVQAQLVPMQWYDGESYQTKYNSVTVAIVVAKEQGYTVSLVGESAGASMAMNVFAHNESLHRFISLCGVNSFHASVSPRILARSPAFKESLTNLAASQRQALREQSERITSITALSDSVVSPAKNKIEGVRHKRIFSIGHLPSILLGLSLLSFTIIGEIKRK